MHWPKIKQEVPAWFFIASLFLPHALGTIAFIVSLFIWFWISPKKPVRALSEGLLFNPALWLLLSWVLMVVSLLWSKHIDEGLKHIFFKLPFALLPLIFSFGRSISDRKSWSNPLIISAVLIGFYCLVRVGIDGFMAKSSDHIDYHWLFTYENLAGKVGIQPVYLTLFFTLSLIGLVENWQRQNKNWFLQISLTLFLLIFIFLLSSRTGIIVCLFSLAIWAIHWIRCKGISLGFFMGAAIPIALLVALLNYNRVMFSRFSEALDFRADYRSQDWGSSSLRLEKWKNSLDLWKKNPVLGTGVGDFQHDLDTVYKQNGFLVGLENHFNSHNQYLQLMAQFGILGLIFWLLFLFSGFYVAFSRKDVFVLMVFLVISLSMLTESLLERRFGLFLVLMWSMLYATSSPKSADQKEASQE